MTQSDRITELDLGAYVDDQLDARRRVDVEAWLASRPEDAARVKADLRTRDELRLALALPSASGSPATNEPHGVSNGPWYDRASSDGSSARRPSCS